MGPSPELTGPARLRHAGPGSCRLAAVVSHTAAEVGSVAPIGPAPALPACTTAIAPRRWCVICRRIGPPWERVPETAVIIPVAAAPAMVAWAVTPPSPTAMPRRFSFGRGFQMWRRSGQRRPVDHRRRCTCCTSSHATKSDRRRQKQGTEKFHVGFLLSGDNRLTLARNPPALIDACQFDDPEIARRCAVGT